MTAQQFVTAVHILHSHSSTAAERRAAEQWLLQFQRSEACWAACTHLLLPNGGCGVDVGVDVQLLAAQTLKSRAQLSISLQPKICRMLQRDLLQLLHQLPPALSQQQILRQLCLALVPTCLALVDSLLELLSEMLAANLTQACLLVLEMVADEASTLQHFGPAGACHGIAPMHARWQII
jgi:hypothetical protein